MFEATRAAANIYSYASSGLNVATEYASKTADAARNAYESYESGPAPVRPPRRGERERYESSRGGGGYDTGSRGGGGGYERSDRGGYDRGGDSYRGRDYDSPSRGGFDSPSRGNGYDRPRGETRRRDDDFAPAPRGGGGSRQGSYDDRYRERDPYASSSAARRGGGSGYDYPDDRRAPPRSNSRPYDDRDRDRDYDRRPSREEYDTRSRGSRTPPRSDSRRPPPQPMSWEDEEEAKWRKKQDSIARWRDSARNNAGPPEDGPPDAYGNSNSNNNIAAHGAQLWDKVTTVVAKVRGDLGPDEPDADGDTELSRAMKKYYTDKAATREDLPRWLFGDVTSLNLDVDLPAASIRRNEPVYNNSGSGGGGSFDFDIYANKDMGSISASNSQSSTLIARPSASRAATSLMDMRGSGSGAPVQSAAALRLKAMREAQKAGAAR